MLPRPPRRVRCIVVWAFLLEKVPLLANLETGLFDDVVDGFVMEIIAGLLIPVLGKFCFQYRVAVEGEWLRSRSSFSYLR